MNVYILDDVAELTDSYHANGALVVIARDLDHAKELVVTTPTADYVWKQVFCQQPTDEEWAAAKVLALAEDAEPAVHVHPDAGCC